MSVPKEVPYRNKQEEEFPLWLANVKSFDAPKNISYLEILNDESVPLKYKYYNDFRKEFNIPDTI